ncbi:Protein of unknown function [Gryllus bimaculatus]|nr:Protein of unknown function [Gryllus bimaculatus]
MFGEVRHFLRLDSNLLFRSLYFVKETKALGHCVYRRTCCLKPAKISFSALSIKGESYILSFVKQRTVFYRSAMSCNETKLTERTTGGNLQSGQDIKDNSDNVENNARISSDNLYLEQELKNNDSEGKMNVEDSNVLEGPVMTLDSVTSVEHSDYPQEVGEVSSVSISDTVIAGITTSIASQCTPKIEEESIVVMKYCWTDDEGTSGKENEDSDSEVSRSSA